MVSRISIVPWAAFLSVGLAVWPFAPAAAALLSVFNSATGAAAAYQTGIPPGPTPTDSHTATQSGDTGPVHSFVDADQGADARFAVGHAVSRGTIDFGYFAGTADSQAMVPRGMLDTDGTGREFEYWASSYADVVAESQASFLAMPTSPWLIGTIGTVVVPIDVHGTVSATLVPDSIFPGGHLRSDSYAQVTWSMSVSSLASTPTNPLSGMLFGTVDTFGTSSGDMPGLHTLSFDVVLGEPTILSLRYDLHSSVGIGSMIGVGGRGQGLAEMGNTFRWMGISQVLDAQGNPIQYSIQSDATFDWTQAAPSPVPAPPTLALLATALGAVCARTRRLPRAACPAARA